MSAGRAFWNGSVARSETRSLSNPSRVADQKTQYDDTNKRFGEPPLPGQSYADIDDIDRLLSLPDAAIHRDVDKVVLAANDAAGVVTAVVAPSTIYGRGRGPVNRRSQQVPALAAYALREGYAPVVGTGRQEWNNVHVADVSAALALLVDAALDPARNRDPERFGPRAYYVLEVGSHAWGSVAEWVARAVHDQGFAAEARTETRPYAEVMARGGSHTWAANSKGVTQRAPRYLGWRPAQGSLEDDIPDTVAWEAERLGIKPAGRAD